MAFWRLGFNIVTLLINDLTFLAGIAQLIEQKICNQRVIDSNPIAGLRGNPSL
jgi:hypothetical protein